MKHTQRPSLRRLAVVVATTCCAGLSGLAHAESHALIMTIDYAGTRAELPVPGIESDGNMARQIAIGMGVPASNIRWLRNGALGLAGMSSAIEDFTSKRVHEGDKVFVYYSGHGTQFDNGNGGSKCTEAMVTADLQPYTDDKLEAALGALAAKASQVVMMNDSCYSGGQASKSLDAGGDGAVAKVFHQKSGSANDESYVCGKAMNKGDMSRTLGIVGRNPSTRMLYVAASADNEVSWARRNGSTATLAWGHCLGSREADLDGNGIIDGEELRKCAQSEIDRTAPRRQTVTIRGEGALPLSFTAASSGGQTTVQNLSQTLETLRAAADPTIPVELSIKNAKLKINRDLLDFSVRTKSAGYLYLLHVDTSGKFYQLFPNALDKNNYVDAGTYRFPRPSWGIQAQGPQGKSYVMAYFSATPRNFSKDMGVEGSFPMAEPTDGTVRKLAVVALGGRYGASRVVAIEEVQ